jgi:hypothetical protein
MLRIAAAASRPGHEKPASGAKNRYKFACNRSRRANAKTARLLPDIAGTA